MSKREFEQQSSSNFLLPIASKWFWNRIFDFVRYFPWVGTLKYDCATDKFIQWRNNVYYPKHQKKTLTESIKVETVVCNSKERAKSARTTPLLILLGLLDVIPCACAKIYNRIKAINIISIKYIDILYCDGEYCKNKSIRIKGKDIMSFGVNFDGMTLDASHSRNKSCLETLYTMTDGGLTIQIPNVKKVHYIVSELAKRSVYALEIKERFHRKKTILISADFIRDKDGCIKSLANVNQSVFYDREQFTVGHKFDARTGNYIFYDRPKATVDIYWENEKNGDKTQIMANKSLVKDCIKQNNWLIGLDSETYNNKYYAPANKKAATKKEKK